MTEILCSAVLSSAAATHEIENRHLKVCYDEQSGAFNVVNRTTGAVFVRDGVLVGTCRVKGKKLIVSHADGRTVLELRGGEPFVFVTKEIHNVGAEMIDLPNVVVATFAIDLCQSVGELRTLGTGGLLEADKNPGSYRFLTCADPATRRGVVAGWVTEDRGSGVMFSDAKEGRVEFKAQLDYGHLRIPAGATEKLETLAIGYFDDARFGLEHYAELIRKQYDISLRPRQAVYCTWYADQHNLAGDEESTLELAEFISRELKGHGLDVVQIDDQWQDGPEIDGPRRGFERARPGGPYPNGIAPVAERVNKLGLTLGLWWLPFGRNHADPAWQDRQHWFAKWADGQPMRTKGFGGTCLDLTHPDVQEHLAGIARLYREWGVTYYKMDGLWTGTATEQVYINDGYVDDRMSNVAPFHDPMKTQIEAFRDGLRLLRCAAGDDVFFSGCCVSQNMRSFGGSMGLVDSMRIGPDFDHDGQGIKTGPLRASRLYFLNGRVWWNDPDPTLIRLGSLDMARLAASYTAISGQFFLLSDWLPGLAPERIEILKRTMLSHDGTARPVDYFDRALPSIWHLQSGERHVLGLFNWDDKPQSLGATLQRAGLDPSKTYFAYDFWKNELLPDIRESFGSEVPAVSCMAIALRADEGRPVVLSTSRHVTQGIVDLPEEQWSGRTLSGTAKVVANDPYELRIRVPEGWQLDKSSVPTEESSGLVRVLLNSEKTGNVSWKVSFTRVKG
jgi:hypothetical protein